MNCTQYYTAFVVCTALAVHANAEPEIIAAWSFNEPQFSTTYGGWNISDNPIQASEGQGTLTISNFLDTSTDGVLFDHIRSKEGFVANSIDGSSGGTLTIQNAIMQTPINDGIMIELDFDFLHFKNLKLAYNIDIERRGFSEFDLHLYDGDTRLGGRGYNYGTLPHYSYTTGSSVALSSVSQHLEDARILITFASPGVGIGAFTSLDNITIYGERVPSETCPPDLTFDDMLDFFDLSVLIDNRVDYNDDGFFDFFDISAFLQDYTTGCP